MGLTEEDVRNKKLFHFFIFSVLGLAREAFAFRQSPPHLSGMDPRLPRLQKVEA